MNKPISLNFIDLILLLFEKLYELSTTLYNFVTTPISEIITDNPLIAYLTNVPVIGTILDFIVTNAAQIFNFTIIDNVVGFVLIGLAFVLIKHVLLV